MSSKTILMYMSSFILFSLSSSVIADDMECTLNILGKFKAEYGSIAMGTPVSLHAQFKLDRDKDIDRSHADEGEYVVTSQTNKLELFVNNNTTATAAASIDRFHVQNRTPQNTFHDGDLVWIETRDNGSIYGTVGGIAQYNLEFSLVDTDGDVLLDNRLPLNNQQWEQFVPTEGLGHTIQLSVDQNNPSSNEIPIDSVVANCKLLPKVNCNNALSVNGIHNITSYGAIANDSQDDTVAITKAIDAACEGDTVFVPSGLFRVNNEISIRKHINIKGQGGWSALFQENGKKDLLSFGDASCEPACLNNISVEDIYLGSVNSIPGSSPALLRLEFVHRSIFNNIVLQGSHTGIHMSGALANNFQNLKSANNVRRFPLAECITPNVVGEPFRCFTKQWVHMEPLGVVSPNANIFINPVLEGGKHGFLMNGNGGQGSFKIFGGVISVFGDHGNGIHHEKNDQHPPGKAIHVIKNGHPIVISGMHIEGGDVLFEGARHVMLDGSLVIGDCIPPNKCIGGGHVEIVARNEFAGPYASRDITISTSMIERISIDMHTNKTRLMNVSLGISEFSNVLDEASDTFYLDVSGNTIGTSKSTIGFGAPNPEFKPPQNPYRISIKGQVQEIP